MGVDTRRYRNFKVAVYCRVEDVLEMAETEWLAGGLDTLQQSINIDKVYLETHRSIRVAESAVMEKVKDFFEGRGIQTSGGITPVADEHDQFRSFCYSDPEHRAKLKEVVSYTAGLFDEVILDDFFFTNCKCARCIEAKGTQSWTAFRLAQMAEVSQNLVVAPAREANPDVRLVIKYPNWYAHYHYTGYNLEAEPPMFDMIYTGTETRDPVHQHQHLQAYQGYAILRYLEHVKPGKNGGGWVDPYARRTLDRYGEQIAFTLFAKAREMTLFCFSDLLESRVAPVAGAVLEDVDSFLDQLGQPYGLAGYRPYHAAGEDYLYHYFGMLGIPIDLFPEFPTDNDTILLTECASADEAIVDKIRAQLMAGKRVAITSGLLQGLQGRGIEEIVELAYTDKKATVHEFSQFSSVYSSDGAILIPQVKYATNDAWELVTCLDKDNGYPLLLEARYGNGKLYVLTIPDNFSDLYQLPAEVLARIRQVLMKEFPVTLEGPSRICLFTYDNDTAIVHSLLPHRTECKLLVKQAGAQLCDLVTGEAISGYTRNDETVFELSVRPHTCRVLRWAR